MSEPIVDASGIGQSTANAASIRTPSSVPYSSVTTSNFLEFGDNALFRNDDGSSGAINISSIFENGIRIGDVTYTQLHVNNNGNITFGGSLSRFTPGVIGGNTGLNIIAPFWADVDTRVDVPSRVDGVFYDLDTTRDSVIVTWSNVGYYSQRIDRLNSFQLELRDRGAGNIEIIFRYEDINWTTGGASGGTGGLGGTIARGGFSLGGTYFELSASGSQSAMLSLEDDRGNRGVAGVWQFLLQDGQTSGFGTTGNNIFVGTEGADSYFALEGNDSISGRGGSDRLYGGAGNDTIVGGDGSDVMDAGSGVDRLVGGAGNDTYITDGNDVMIESSNAGVDTIQSSVRECHELCVSGLAHAGFRYGHALKRSSNMIANWFRAANHSRTFLPPFSKLRMDR